MKLYIVLYHMQFNKTWETSNVFEDEALAAAQLHYERLLHPKWRFFSASVDVPDEPDAAQ